MPVFHYPECSQQPLITLGESDDPSPDPSIWLGGEFYPDPHTTYEVSDDWLLEPLPNQGILDSCKSMLGASISPFDLEAAEELDTTSLISDLLSDRVSEMQTKTVEKITAGSAKLMAYIGNIIVCTTYEQYMLATTQFFLSIAGQGVVDYLMQRQPFQVQGEGDSVMDKLLGYIRSTRTLNSSFFESPIYSFFIDTIGIASLCGVCEGISCKDVTLVSGTFTQHARTSVMVDFPAAVLRSLEFAVEVSIDFFRGASLKRYVYGRGVLTTCCELLSKRTVFRGGLLDRSHNTNATAYLADIRKCLTDMTEYIRRGAGASKSVAIVQRAKLVELEAEVCSAISLSGFRKRPFTILLAGKSAVGKTSCLASLIPALGDRFGYATEPENVATVTEMDKFDPHKGTTRTVIMDDINNAKNPDKLPETPCAKLIRYNNVTPSMAIKADVDEKNVIPIDMDTLIITTNVTHLNAARDSAEPQSILNRINVAVDVRPKEYCRCPKTGKLLRNLIKRGPKNQVLDCPQEAATITYTVKNGKVCWDKSNYLDFDDYQATVLIPAMAKHREIQEDEYKRFKSTQHVKICKECNYRTTQCVCECESDSDSQFSNQGMLTSQIRKLFDTVRGTEELDRQGAGMAVVRLLTFTSSWVYEADVIEKYCNTKISMQFTEWFWKYLDYYEFSILFAVSLLFFECIYFSALFAFIQLVFMLYILYSVLYQTHRIARKIVADTMTESVPNFGAGLLDSLLMLPALAAGFYVVRAMIKNMRVIYPQGNIAPTTIKDIDKRNNEPNEWIQPDHIYTEVLAHHKVCTSTASSVEATIRSITYLLRVPAKEEGKTVRCHCMRVYGGFLLIPRHSFMEMDIEAEGEVSSYVGSLPKRVNPIRFNTDSIRLIGKDQVAISVSGIPDSGDFRYLFAERATPGLVDARIIMPHRDVSPSLNAKYTRAITTECATITGFSGHITSPDQYTAKGDCGCVWMSLGKVNAIIGIHNAGKNDIAVCENVDRGALNSLSEPRILEKMVMESHGYTMRVDPHPPIISIDTKVYDEDIYTGPDIDPHACVNFGQMSEDNRSPIVEVYGTCNNTRAKTYSTIEDTPLSCELAVEGLPQKWGKPKMKPNYNFAETFQTAQHHMKPFPHEALMWAIQDYVDPMVKKIHELAYYCNPLNMYEAFNGRKDDKQHINPMNMKTSPGLGLAGKKIDHADVSMEEDGRKIYTPKPHIVEEVNRIEEVLASGARACPISNGALKDEPTKIGKTKVRVFFVMPMAFLIIGRILLCPILAFIASNPLLSESWFGVRTTTDEWSQAYEYMTDFTTDTFVNGDYSAYDQRINQQLLWAVGCVFSALASAMGFSDYYITMLHAWFADIARPIYAFHGTLLSFVGYQPSGNNGTVAVNGVCNSLIHRLFFYIFWCAKHGKPPPVGCFRDYVRLGVVGDDSLGAVHKSIADWFNMVNLASFLKSYGMKYTMPDKTDEIIPFYNISQVSLCKRTFRVVSGPMYAGIDRVVLAPIEIDSIMKSLHNFHAPQSNPWLVLRGNISQGLRELARNDRDTFYEYRNKIARAVERANVEGIPVPMLEYSYEEWQDDIYTRYQGIVKSATNTEEELDVRIFNNLDTIFE